MCPSGDAPHCTHPLGIYSSTALRAGTDDTGGVGPEEKDWTIFTTLRLHSSTQPTYYWR